MTAEMKAHIQVTDEFMDGFVQYVGAIWSRICDELDAEADAELVGIMALAAYDNSWSE